MPIKQNLGIILDNDKILLGMKKRGFGEGWYNGLGGKVKDLETIEQALERECLEEAGISIREYQKRGEIQFHFPDKDIEVSVYAITTYNGTPKESEEMKWEWFPISEIPYNKMWPADRHWLPVFLEGKRFSGEVTFDANKRVISYEFTKSD